MNNDNNTMSSDEKLRLLVEIARWAADNNYLHLSRKLTSDIQKLKEQQTRVARRA